MLSHKEIVTILQGRYHLPTTETQELARSMRGDLSLARTIEAKRAFMANYRDETSFVGYLEELEEQPTTPDCMSPFFTI
jgi:hypothetical protein